jgi:hypothetical protein
MIDLKPYCFTENFEEWQAFQAQNLENAWTRLGLCLKDSCQEMLHFGSNVNIVCNKWEHEGCEETDCSTRCHHVMWSLGMPLYWDV